MQRLLLVKSVLGLDEIKKEVDFMRMVDIIEKKRDGKELSAKEIKFLVEGYTNGDIPDYQMSAFLMAEFFQGLTDDEIFVLTEEMIRSGETIDLDFIDGVADKHSTGGVGDTTSVILGPLLASIGVPIAKMSGRGLGHTGGTLDKLESIEGFQIEVSVEKFKQLVKENDLAIVGTSAQLAPFEKKIYELRDVTGTINSIPIIASAIMAKKIAGGADVIVLDVKVGSGAFMKEMEDARKLAETMVKIGEKYGKKTTAFITDMDQPLGKCVGNALEIKEAIATLKGEGPKDLEELCLTLGSHMAFLAKKASSIEEAKEKLIHSIQSGLAIQKFKSFVKLQGGDDSVVDNVEKLPTAKYQINILSDNEGYVTRIKADEIGHAAMLLGAGRETKQSTIDLSVGIELHKKVGSFVQKDDVLATVHSNEESVDHIISKIIKAFTIEQHPRTANPLIYEIIKNEM